MNKTPLQAVNKYSVYLQGLPISVWHELSTDAEDEFFNRNLGQCLLGIYPCGPVLLGIQGTPELFCLYLGNPQDLLNPTKLSTFNQKFPFTGKDDQFLYMDLFLWLRWITTGIPLTQATLSFLHIIPCEVDPIFESPAITEILAFSRQYLLSAKYLLPGLIFSTLAPTREKLLRYRTFAILSLTGDFRPSIVPEHLFSLASIGNLDSFNLLDKDYYDILRIDSSIINDQPINLVEATKYTAFISDCISTNPSTTYSKSALEELSIASTEYFRSLI